MRAFAIAVLAAGFAFFGATLTRADDAQPWVADAALVTSVWSDVHSGGIRAVEPKLAQMEQALARGPAAIAQAGAQTDPRVFLVDGAAESLILLGGLAGSTQDTFKGRTVAAANPYPQIGLLLGSYYDEIGKPQEAVRVLDAGLAASMAPDMHLGETVSNLDAERGVALAALRRWPESLASYDAGLEAASDDDPAFKALLLRGRGYALTELNRLDDAEKAYNDSLALAPGNALAQHEIAYIQRLRAGAPRIDPGGIKPLQPPPGTEPPPEGH